MFASNTSTLPITGLAANQRPSGSSAPFLLARSDKMKLVEIIRGPATSDDRRPRLRLCARHRQDADRRQRLARLLHQPVFWHLRDGRRGDAGRKYCIPAPLIENAGLPPACRSGRWRWSTTSLSLSVHVMEQTWRRTSRRRVSPFAPDPAQCPARADGQGVSGVPDARAAARVHDYPSGQPKHLVAGLKAHFFEKPGITRRSANSQRLLYRQAIGTHMSAAGACSRQRTTPTSARFFGIGFRRGRVARCSLSAKALPPSRSTPPKLAETVRRSFLRAECRRDRIATRPDARRRRLHFCARTPGRRLLGLGLADLLVGPGIGTGPQTPDPPFADLAANVDGVTSGRRTWRRRRLTRRADDLLVDGMTGPCGSSSRGELGVGPRPVDLSGRRQRAPL